MFFPQILGLVLISREQPHYCRRLSAPGAIYTSPATYVSLATTVEKIANITRYSHIASWDAWLGRTMVRLRWTSSICRYCIHASLNPLLTSTPGTPAIQVATTRSLCDDTTEVRYLYSPNPGTTTINCYFEVSSRNWRSPRSSSRIWGAWSIKDGR